VLGVETKSFGFFLLLDRILKWKLE